MMDEAKEVQVISTDRVCDCAYCHDGRVVHWFCDGCGSGPFRFSFADPGNALSKTPYGQRQFNRPDGLVGGIRRWCSEKCAISEEKIYLVDLLEKAQARRDLTTVRVITGRLHEMANSNKSVQIPSTTEKLQRHAKPEPVVERAPLLTNEIGEEGDA